MYKTAEVSRQLTAAAFDTNGEIKPCALVKTPNEVGNGPYVDSTRVTVVVYLYQRSGYDTVDAAELAVFNLLNRKKIGSRTWNVMFDSVQGQQMDFALDCAMVVSRYQATRRKV